MNSFKIFGMLVNIFNIIYKLGYWLFTNSCVEWIKEKEKLHVQKSQCIQSRKFTLMTNVIIFLMKIMQLK